MTHNKNLTTISIHEIFTPAKRIKALNKIAIDAIAQSIKEIGLQNPIQVQKTEHGYEVVAGVHRLNASTTADLHEIPCIVLDDSTTAEDLLAIEIDENLCQGTLTACEFIESLYLRKGGYEEQHPEINHGGARRGEDFSSCKTTNLKSFVPHIAELTGVSPRKIYSGLSAYPVLEPIWRLVRISAIKDQFTQITSLAGATDSKGEYGDEEYRLKLLELINDNDLPMINKVKDAMNHLKGKVFDSPKDKNIFAFESRWENAPTEYRKAVYESHAVQIISDLKELGYL